MVFEALMGYDKLVNENPLCPYSDKDYGSWYWYTCYCVLGAFFFVWVMLLLKLINCGPSRERIPFFTAFHIVSMATVSTFLSLVFEWGGVCIDLFG